MTKDHLNKVREAIACLEEAASYISRDFCIARKLHTRIQDAGDRLVEVREEIQMRLEAEENFKKAVSR
jgi:hypothetical protein